MVSDIRHPVAHRLVDRVLERRRPRRHRAHLRAERAHAQDVGALTLDVLGTHVHDARQVEQRTRRRGRHAVLAGTGLGDDPGLAEAAGQERLARGVVDLVRPGVSQGVALEVTKEPQGAGRVRRVAVLAPSPDEPSAGLDPDRLGQAIGTVESRRTARRTFPGARAAPPRRQGPGGEQSYASSSCTRAAISVSGT